MISIHWEANDPEDPKFRRNMVTLELKRGFFKHRKNE